MNAATIEINNQSRLYKLRADNTKLCIELTISALNKFKQQRSFNSKPQQKVGRYYSFMPTVLKEICLINFNKYVNSQLVYIKYNLLKISANKKQTS